MGSDGQRRIESFASHGEIIWRRRVGIFARKNISHKQFHVVTADTEYAEASFKTRGALYFYLEFNVGHALLIEVRNPFVYEGMLYAGCPD